MKAKDLREMLEEVPDDAEVILDNRLLAEQYACSGAVVSKESYCKHELVLKTDAKPERIRSR